MRANLTDVAMFQLWIQEKKDIAPSSIMAYVTAVERFLMTNPDIDSLEPYNMFIIEHSIKKRICHYPSALKAFIEYKITDSSLKNKLIEGLIKPKIYNDVKMERKYLSEDEIFDVINKLDEQKHKVIALIQALTGARAGDVMRLRRGEGQEGIMPEEFKGKPVLRLNIVGKGKRRNTMFIHDEIAQEVVFNYISSVYGNYNDYYFIDRKKYSKKIKESDNEYMIYRRNYVRYWRDLKQALQANGFSFNDFASHDMRRCFARRCWERYRDVNVLQKMLHHANPTVTLKYLQQSGMATVDYEYEMQMLAEKKQS